MSDLPPGSDPFASRSPYVPPGRVEPRSVWVYAGFWFRVLAWGIDACIISVAGWVVGLLLSPSLTVTLMNSGPGVGKYQISDLVRVSDIPAEYSYQFIHPAWHGSGLYELVQFILPALYYILFESSRLQATPGKMACRMRVTDIHGSRITIGRAAGRYFGKFLSFILMGIGFLMVMWTARKQGLHDLLAGTCVIRRQEEALVNFAPPG